jgi:hypothetical protein
MGAQHLAKHCVGDGAPKGIAGTRAAVIWMCQMVLRVNTAFLLMAQYGGAAVIPLDVIRRDYFSHLTIPKLLQKVLAGQIKLPIVRIEDSQKAARGVHLQDLADYIDQQREKALKEVRLLAAE